MLSRALNNTLARAAIAAGLALVSTVPATALTITRGAWTDSSTALFLDGDFEQGDAAAVRKAIRESRGALVVAVLNSPGGNLAEALRVGRLLKDAGASTFVPSWATCASACFYAYAGGKTRYVGEGARIGVHQFSYTEAALEDANTTVRDAQELTAEINLYLMSTGVSPMVGTLAGTVPPNEMLFFDYEDLQVLGIVTSYSEDSGAWASARAASLSGGEPVVRFTKDPSSIDWCNVPVFSADGTFKKDPSTCSN
jgi:hypothetical protein